MRVDINSTYDTIVSRLSSTMGRSSPELRLFLDRVGQMNINTKIHANASWSYLDGLNATLNVQQSKLYRFPTVLDDLAHVRRVMSALNNQRHIKLLLSGLLNSSPGY